jgi:hypothetical protein
MYTRENPEREKPVRIRGTDEWSWKRERSIKKERNKKKILG